MEGPDDVQLLDADGLQALVARVRAALGSAEPEEKRMFGGVVFMVAGNMLCCASKKGLMVRVGAAAEPAALERPHARRCEGTGRQMPGFVMVSPVGVEKDVDLAGWLRMAGAYVSSLPPKAKKAAKR